MNIDLNNVYKKDIDIDMTITYEEDYYEKTSIKKLDPIIVNGKVSLNDLEEMIIDLKIEGFIYLEDAISLELIKYPIDINILETIDFNDEYYAIENNIMDLKEFVWKNIVLEIPISVTKNNKEFKQIEGDGWSLNSKKEEPNAFDKLNDLFK